MYRKFRGGGFWGTVGKAYLFQYYIWICNSTFHEEKKTTDILEIGRRKHLKNWNCRLWWKSTNRNIPGFLKIGSLMFAFGPTSDLIVNCCLRQQTRSRLRWGLLNWVIIIFFDWNHVSECSELREASWQSQGQEWPIGKNWIYLLANTIIFSAFSTELLFRRSSWFFKSQVYTWNTVLAALPRVVTTLWKLF